MMQDVFHRSWYGRYFDLILLISGVLLGLCFAEGIEHQNTAVDEGNCGQLIKGLIVLPCIVVGSLILFNPLRQRVRSVQFWPVAVLKILLALCVGGGGVSVLVINIMLIIDMTQAIETDTGCPATAVTISILLAVFGFIYALFFLISVIHVIYMRFVFMKPEPTPYHGYESLIRYARTKKGYCIPVVFYPKPGATVTVIYSHGNAVDLGQLLVQGKLRGMRDELNVNVLSYEYAGYGYAGGPSTEADIVESLRTALETAVQLHGVKMERIVLYGRSIGSCPTVNIAAQLKRGEILGIILESPPMSILRTVRCFNHCCKTLPFDMFSSIDIMSNVDVLTYVTHGTEDDVVPVEHGKRLYAASTNQYPWPSWVEGASHNNMPDVWQYKDPEYLKDMPDEVFQEKLDENEVFNDRNTQHSKDLRDFVRYALMTSEERASEKKRRGSFAAVVVQEEVDSKAEDYSHDLVSEVKLTVDTTRSSAAVDVNDVKVSIATSTSSRKKKTGAAASTPRHQDLLRELGEDDDNIDIGS